MDPKATAPMVKSSWIWSGGNYADSDALAKMTANLNPMEVAQAALDAGIPESYYKGNIPSQWTMTGGNAEAYSKFLDSIGKLKAMEGQSIHVGDHPVRGSLDFPAVRKGNAIGNLAEQEAALLTRIAEIDGLLTDKDTVQQWKDHDLADDHTLYGVDYGGHLIHPNYDPENYVNPLELEARAQAASLVAEGKLAKADMAAWVSKAVAGRRQELMAERGKLNAAEEALRNGPMGKFVKPVFEVMNNVDAGGDTLTRARMQAAGVPLGQQDVSYASVGLGLTDKLGKFVYDHNPWGNWVLDHTPGAGWLSKKLGFGEKGSDIVRQGAHIPLALPNSVLGALDKIRQGDRASEVNNAFEGRVYGNDGVTAKTLNDMRSGNGEIGTGSQGSNWWSTSWVPGLADVGINAVFAGGLAKSMGMGGAKVIAGKAAPAAAKAVAPSAKSVVGKFISSPSVKNFLTITGLQAYDGFSEASKHHGDVIKTKVPKPDEQALPTKEVPELRRVSGNGVTLANAGESLAARGKDAFDAEMVDAVMSVHEGKPYVPGSRGASGVNKRVVENAEASLPEGGTSTLSRWWNGVKENPWPWLAGAGAVVGGGMLLGKYLSNRRKERERKKTVRAPQVRNYPVPYYSGVKPVQAPQLRGGWSGDDPFDFYTGDFYY